MLAIKVIRRLFIVCFLFVTVTEIQQLHLSTRGAMSDNIYHQVAGHRNLAPLPEKLHISNLIYQGRT